MKKLLIVLTLIGCGSKVSTSTTEDARLQAKANALFNVQKFLSDDPRYRGSDVVTRGDSTINEKCPQGDGWASVTLLNRETKQTSQELKCSTHSIGIGCMTLEDFEKKTFKSEENTCQSTDRVPFPLPKLGSS